MNKEKDINNYDLTEIYQSTIHPIVQKLKILCGAHKIPMFFAAAVKNDASGTTYVKECMLAATGIKIQENRINKLIMKARGCSASPPAYVIEAIKTLEEYIENMSTNITIKENEAIKEEELVYSEPDKVMDVTEPELLNDLNLIASMEGVDIELPEDIEENKDALLAGEELFNSFEDDDIMLDLPDEGGEPWDD